MLPQIKHVKEYNKNCNNYDMKVVWILIKKNINLWYGFWPVCTLMLKKTTRTVSGIARQRAWTVLRRVARKIVDQPRSFGLLIRDFVGSHAHTRDDARAGVHVIRVDANEWRMNGARSEWRKVNHGSPYRCAPGFRGCTGGPEGRGVPLILLITWAYLDRGPRATLGTVLRLFRTVHYRRIRFFAFSLAFSFPVLCPALFQERSIWRSLFCVRSYCAVTRQLRWLRRVISSRMVALKWLVGD